MMRKLLILLIYYLQFVINNFAFAQDGSLDTSFNSTDIGFGFGDGASWDVNTIVLQSDGKIIIGGDFTSYNGTAINRIARLDSAGTLDLSFNSGTGASGTVATTTLQSDGKIIIGGAFTSYNGTPINSIARLNSDGTLDLSFNPGTGADSTVITTALQIDGKIIIGGAFTSINGTAISRIARLNSDGTLDTSFNPGSGADSTVITTALQSDGKIIIGGNFTSYNGTGRNYIARLDSVGTLDLSFNPGTGANDIVNTTAIQSDGKIIIGGAFTFYNGTGRNRIARINSDGTLDLSFNPGIGTNNNVYTTALQSDGKIIIGGGFFFYNGTGRNNIARINSDGTLDLFFNPGTGTNSTVFTTALQSDGKIIIGGEFYTYNGTGRNRIARTNSDGTLDLSFNPGTGANSIVFTTALQNDEKIIIGGAFTSYNGTAINRISRLNSDGTLDLFFNPGTGASGVVATTTLQSDGKIIIGGGFIYYNGTPINAIARLNSDGTLDLSFNTGTGANGYVETTALQTDGKIIIGGAFTTYNGTSINRIARLDSDGTLDTSFNPGTGANNYVETTAMQNDGKIIIGGQFTSYNGTAINRIARLNSDGTLDLSFNPGTGAGGTTVVTTALQSDGKIIIGGEFFSYNGTARTRIARINIDGTLDLSFNPGTGANGYVATTALQSDGKIIIGGWFTSYNGTAINHIARLNSDGTLDLSFNPGTGVSSNVYKTALQNDGKIIIGGAFTSYNGIGRNRIARVLNCLSYTTPVSEAICSGDSILLQGSYQTTVGTYYDTLTAVNGCDSIVNTNLTVLPINFSQSPTICSGQSITVGSNTYTASGTYTDTLTAVNGCDSIVTTNLTVLPINFSQSPTICSGQSITVGSNTYTTSGTYTDTLMAVNSCDSIVTTNLTVLDPNTFAQSPTVCAGQGVTVGSNTYTASGTYTDTLMAVSTCDSIVTTNLTVLDPDTFAQSPTVCAGQGVTVGSNTYTASGTYTDTLTAVNNCDSIVTTNLTVLDPNTFAQSPTVCAGQGITVGSNTYTASGTYTDTLTAVNSCDSIITTNLTVLSAITSVDSIVPATCGNNNGSVSVSPSGGDGAYTYSWSNGNTTYSVTGLTGQPTDTLIVTINDSIGCILIDTAIVNCVTGIAKNNTETDFNVYPNPNTGEFVIEFNIKDVQNIEIKLLTADGRVVYHEDIKEFRGSIHREIDMNNYAKGIYELQILTDEGKYAKKIIYQ